MGKLWVIGIGPGSPDQLTKRAAKALGAAEVICGYTLYVDLLRPFYPEKEFWSTGMTGEIERCRHALRLASEGRTVALVCSGDAGVYGLAGPVLELAPDWPDAEVEIIPGVTAALSGAALSGAPLGHDFCIISLSDRLTDWSVIEKRLRCAAEGDFALCLYNPASRHRKDTLRRACEVLLETRSEDTVCAMVRQIGREGESFRLLTLRALAQAEADMFTTVFIGSSRTREIGGKMVTPRGYRV
jgi:precorrin-3B C17-methyltransferase